MRNIQVLLLGWLMALWLPATAQDGWLYRMEGQGIRSSWLIGALPATDPQVFQFSDSVFHAIMTAPQLAFDLVLDSSEMATQEETSQLINGGRFDKQLTKAQLAVLQELYQQHRRGAMWDYMSYSPLYFSELLLQWQRNQQDARSFLLNMGRQQEKRIIGLYTGEDLSGLYNTIPVQLQIDLLVSAASLWSTAVFPAAQAAQYLTARPTRLDSWMAQWMPMEYQRLYQQGKVNILARQIPALLRRQSTCVVVDATLLGGNNGLLSALKKEGIILTPIGTGLTMAAPPTTTATEADTMVFEGGQLGYYKLNEEFGEAYFEEVVPNWYRVNSFRGAFSVRMPDVPEEITELFPTESTPVPIRIFKFEDRALNLFYLVSYYDYPSSFNIWEQPTFWRDVIAQTVSRFNGILLLEKDISGRQYQGREIELQTDEEFTIRVRFYLVGNRMYQVALGANGRKAYSRQNEAFLSSFRILSQRVRGWYPLNLGFAEIEMPAVPRRTTGTMLVDSLPAHYFAYQVDDKQTLMQFGVQVTYLPETVRTRRPASLLNRMVYRLASDVDGVLIREEDREIGSMTGRYVEIGAGRDQVYRVLLLVHKGRLLQLLLSGPEDSAYSTYADYFFDHFTLPDYEL